MNTYPLPEGKVNQRTIEDIARLSLESTSPFSLNDIFWGYCVDGSASTIHIFSALKSRLKAIDLGVEFSHYILPDFIPAIIDPSITKAILKYQDHSTLFEKSIANGMNFTAIDSQSGEVTSLPVYRLIDVTPIPEYGLTVKFTRQDNSSAAEELLVFDFPFTSPLINAVNMQDAVLKKAQKQNKMTTNAMLYVSLVASVTILAGLCGFLELRYLSSGQNRHAKELALKDEHIQQIQLQENRAQELDLFSNKKHAYFRGLEKINELRPESILFQKVYASGGKQFDIECSAKTLADVNKFEKTLLESSLFTVVKVDNKKVHDNQSIQFSILLTFEKL
jgi:Tfp pilus assembly protein PilN